MKRLFLAASAAGLLFAAPAFAQMAPPPPPGGPMGGPMMMGDGMMGGSYAGKSCVMNGAFVPCPPAGGMQPAMMDGRPGMRGPGMREEMDRPMSRREMREMRRMERMQQRGM